MMSKFTARYILLTILILCGAHAQAGAIGGLFNESHLGEGDSCPNLNQGNPINIATGNKYQKFTVYRGQGEFPLDFSFHYNSRAKPKVGKWSGIWSHSYSHAVYVTFNENFGRNINIVRPDGKHSAYSFSYSEVSYNGLKDAYWQALNFDRSTGEHECEVLEVTIRPKDQFVSHTSQPHNSPQDIFRIFRRPNPYGRAPIYLGDPDFSIPENCGDPEGFMRVKAGNVTEVYRVTHKPGGFGFELVELVDESGISQRISRNVSEDGDSYTVVQHANGTAIHLLDGPTWENLFVGHLRNPGITYPKAMIISDDPGLQVTSESFSENAWIFKYSDRNMLTHVGFTAGAESERPENVGQTAGTYVSKAVFKYEAQDTWDSWDHQTALTGYFRTEDNSSHISGWGYDEYGRAYRSYHGPYHSDVGTRSDFPTPSMTQAHEFSLLSHHHIRRVTDHLGRQTDFEFKNNSNKFATVEKIVGNATTNCAGGTQADFTYYLSRTTDGLTGQKRTQTDAKGFITRFKHYAASADGAKLGKPKSVTYAEGTEEELTVNYDWTDTVQLKEYTTPDLKSEYAYHPNGRLWTVTQTDLKVMDGVVSDRHDANTTPVNDKRTWTFTYTYHDRNESVVATKTVDGPRTDVEDSVVFEYDIRGNLRFVRRRADLEITHEYSDYNLWGMPGKIIDPAGVVTDISYWQGASGLHIKSIKSGGSNGYHFEYDHILDQLTKVTLPSGAWYDIFYTSVDGGKNSDIDYIETSSGDKIDFSTTRSKQDQLTTEVVEFLNDSGRVTYVAGRVTDALDRLYKMSSGEEEAELNYDANSNLGALREFGYGSDGLPKEITREFGYDGLNQLASIEAPDSGLINIDKAPDRYQQAVTDGEGRTTLFIYNGFGELVQQTSPDTGVTKYFYDEAGNLADMIKRAGTVSSIHVKYRYDALNRILNVDYPGTEFDEVYQYDQNAPSGAILNLRGRLAYSAKGDVERFYRYSETGQVAWLQSMLPVKDGDVVRSDTIWFYNAATGLLDEIGYPNGVRLTFDYDSQARVSGIGARVRKNGMLTKIPLITDVKYEPFGPVNDFVFAPAGIQHVRLHDLSYRPRLIASRAADRSFQYVMTIDRDKGFGNVDYSNTQTSVGVATEYNYVYDNAHRLKSAEPLSSSGASLAYDYNLIGDRTLRSGGVGSTTYEYLEDGIAGSKITSSTGGVWSFDSLGQLREKDGDLVTLHSSDGRLRTVVSKSDGTAESYVYNTSGQRAVKRQGILPAGDESYTLFSYGEQGELLHERSLSTGEERSYVYLNGQLVAMIDQLDGNHKLYGVVTDQVGAPVQIASESSEVVWEASYSPFGEVQTSIQQIKNNIRFPGQYHDEATGLYYNYHRYYDPSIGRYIQSDPIGLAGGVNTYAYVGGNPLSYSDPSGLCPWCVVGGVVGGGFNAYSQYRSNGGWNNFDWGSFAAGTAAGVLSGGLGTATAAMGTGAGWLLASNTVGSAAIGAGVTAAQNKFTGSCNSVHQAAINGAVFGGLGAGLGLGVTNGIGALNRSAYNNLPLSARTLLGSNALHGVQPPTLVPGGVTAGNFISNTVSNVPYPLLDAK